MALQSRLLDTIPFATGAGNQTVIYPLWFEDISHAREVMLELILNKAQTDATDTLRIRFQDTSDNLTWNTRARFPDIMGNIVGNSSLPPSVTAPITRRMVIQQVNDLAATEKSYKPSGSADDGDLTAGSTLGGPFPGKIYDYSIAKRVPSFRWAF